MSQTPFGPIVAAIGCLLLCTPSQAELVASVEECKSLLAQARQERSAVIDRQVQCDMQSGFSGLTRCYGQNAPLQKLEEKADQRVKSLDETCSQMEAAQRTRERQEASARAEEQARMSSLQAQQRYAREKQVSIELALKSQAAPPAPARAAAAPRIRPGMNSAQLGAALYEALAGGSEGESDDAQSDSSAAESSVASSAPSSGRSGMTESQRKYAEIHDRADATRKDIYKNDDIDPVVSKNIDRSWKQLRKMNLSTAGKMDHAIDDINSITTGVAPAEPSKPGAARQKESTARGAGDGFLPTEACSDLVESGLAPDVVAQANGKIPRLGPLPGYSTTLSSQFGEQRVTMRGCGQALVLRTEIASGGGSRRTILLRGYPHVRPLVDSVEPNFATVGLDAQPYDSREGDFTYTIRNSRLTGGQVLSTVCSGVRLRASAPEFDYKVSCVTDGFTEVFELAIDASNEFSWRLDHGGTHTAFVSDDAPRRSSGGGSKISSASPKHK